MHERSYEMLPSSLQQPGVLSFANILEIFYLIRLYPVFIRFFDGVLVCCYLVMFEISW